MLLTYTHFLYFYVTKMTQKKDTKKPPKEQSKAAKGVNAMKSNN